jgi:hypothetical protein
MIVFSANLLMIGLSVPMVARFGLYGFLIVWLLSESTQMVLIYLENQKLFDYDRSITLSPVIKLVCVMLVSLPLCMLMVHFAQQKSMGIVAVAAILGEIMLIAESSLVFGLKDVWAEAVQKSRFRAKSV